MIVSLLLTISLCGQRLADYIHDRPNPYKRATFSTPCIVPYLCKIQQ